MDKFLIVGLGNTGEEYTNTRHNIGFKILDACIKTEKGSFTFQRFAEIAEFKIKSKSFILIKPTTYVNLSGKAVNYYIQKHHLSLNSLLVVSDDIALPTGTLRLKPKGNDGGHNGLKSINEVLGNNQYPRLRFGIGSDFPKGRQVDYVLGEWTSQETEIIKIKIDTAVQIIKSFGVEGIDNTMNMYNG